MADEPDAAEPYYSEIHVQSLNNINIGITQVKMTLDEDGDTRIDATEVTLIPATGNTLQTSDSTTVSWSTPGGYLINALYGGSENGELVADLSLRTNDEGIWQVRGTLAGKSVSADLGAEAEPASVLGEMMVYQSLVQNEDATSFNIEGWIPSANPMAFSTLSITKDEENDSPNTLRVNLGDLELIGVFDANGSATRGNIDLGLAQIQLKRVFSAGRIK